MIRSRHGKRYLSLMRSFAELFYYGCEVDSWLPQIILIPYITLQWKSQPTWVRIIAPSSSGKSAHISLLFDHKESIMMDEMTPKSLISGYRGMGEDPSKLPMFDEKVLLIADESTMMEQRQEDRNTIQAILRKAYDGRVAKSFGNISEIVEAKAYFNMLVGVTPIIDRYFQYTQSLGERFINFRLQVPNPEALTQRAFDNQFSDYRSRHELLSDRLHRFIDSLPDVSINSIEVGNDARVRLTTCADFIARVRTHISRDFSGRHITTIPRAESAGRLVQQLVQVAAALAVIQGSRLVKESHISKAVYVALCSIAEISAFSLYTAYHLSRSKDGGTIWFATKEFITRTGIGRATTQKVLEDLAVLRVLDMRSGSMQGGRGLEYTLAPEAKETIDKLMLFEHYHPPVRKIKTKKKSRRRSR